MRYLRFALPAALLALIPVQALAFSLDLARLQTLCGLVPCFGGGGAAGLVTFLMSKFIPSIYVVFGGIAGIYLINNAIHMVVHAQDESAASEGRTNIIHIIMGCIVVGISGLLTETFYSGAPSLNIVNEAPLTTGLTVVIVFFKLILGITVVANVVIQASRLLTSQGDSGQIEKARKRLITGFIGVGILLLANAIVSAAVPGAHSMIIGEQIVGIANFLITLVGALAVVAIIVAGIVMVISVDESLKDKGKIALRVGIITLVTMLLSYSIVNTLLRI